jgi:outer membrane protein assembly factor BamB
LLLALSLTACGSSRETAAAPEDAIFRTGNLIEPGHALQLDYDTRWVRSLSLGPGQQVHAAVPVGDLLIVLEKPQNFVTALNLSDGQTQWKRVLGRGLERLLSASGDDDNIYVTTGRRVFILNRSRGEVTDIQDFAYFVEAPSILIDGRLITGSGDGRLFAHDVDAGYKVWAYALPGRITTAPVEDLDNVFAVDNLGNYVMLRSSDGELRWTGSAYGPITAAPALDRSHIILASEDQSLYSLASITGSPRWLPYRSEAPLTLAPTVVDQIIYLPEPGRGLTGIDANIGQKIWNVDDRYTPVLASHHQRVLAFDGQQLAYIDPTTGKRIESVPTRPMRDVVRLPGDEDVLILVGPRGDIIRLDPQ